MMARHFFGNGCSDSRSGLIRINAWILLGLLLALPFAGRADWVEVSADVDTRLTRPLYDFANRISYFDASLVNQNGAVYTQPMRLVVAQLQPAGIAVRNADGVTAEGRPYYEMGPYLGDGRLSPGEVSAARRIELNNPARARFTIDLRVWVEETIQQPPVANAGPDQTVPLGSVVMLDGSGSSDPDGDPLSYAWELPLRPPGSLAALDDPAAVDPSFVVDRPGSYTAELTVHDGTSASAPDQVTIDTLNSPPVADAGPDQSATLGAEVLLDGSGSSDVDGQALSYLWTLTGPSGSTALLDDPGSVTPRFTIDLPGNYLATLRVSDGQLQSTPDSVTITTENTRPLADAGPDQSVPLGATVTLDGSGSGDPDGDALSYLWSLSTPAGSGATLSDATDVAPTFDVDLAGNYVAQLIVNDGLADSAPDTMTVSTLNSRPAACIDSDTLVLVGDALSLDGGCSSDADGDPLTFQWSLTSSPAGGSPELSDTDTETATLVPDLPGLYIVQLIVNDGELASAPVTISVAAVLPPPSNHDPRIDSTPPTEATVGQPYTYDVQASDPDGDLLTYGLTAAPAAMSIDPDSGLIAWTPTDGDLASSPLPVSVQVGDGRGGSALQTFEISVQPASTLPTVPLVTGLHRSVAMERILAGRLSLGALTYQHDGAIPDGEVMSQTPAAGTLVDLGAAVDLVVSLGTDQGLPPNPVTVAPPLNPTAITPFAAGSQFLYTGEHPVQTGMLPETIEERRAAVIRGKVFDRDDNPLPGVTVTILDHPEFGQTLSRSDGAFDLVVNGGGLLTLSYQKAGLLPAQRQVQTPWQDYAFAPDVALVVLDPLVTAIDLTAATIQVARGSASTDADGTRQATLLFPAGTTAEMVLPDGTTQPLTTLNVRATEYTIGPNGPRAMPAQLPPTSGYTYAVEITADEALAAGAVSVNLSRPVPFYVENFIGFPVGSPVPTGWYDRQRGLWIPAPNGRVIAVVTITGGLADLDIDGDGSADAADALAALGIDDAERARLAELYPPGQSLWRVPLDHFTPWDCNWPYGPPAGALPPTGATAGIEAQKTKGNPCEENGSVIACEPQTLGESVAITGTPFSLHYQSGRARGYLAGRTLNVDLTGSDVPPGVKRVRLAISVAGSEYTRTFTPEPDQRFSWTWDGTDGFGRAVAGEQQARVSVSYDYDAVYYASRDEFERSFALASGEPTAIARQGFEIGLEQRSSVDLNSGSAEIESEMGGWSLSVHHRWNPGTGALVRGDGRETRADGFFGAIITTVAGNGNLGFSGDGGPATEASFSYPTDAAVGANGSLYIVDLVSHRIRRVEPDGIITTVAGNGDRGFSGDGGPATAASLWAPHDVAVGADGSLYITDVGNYRIRRVALDGIITTVAGNGFRGFSGDGGPATAASLDGAVHVAVGADGSLYITDVGNYRIRRVALDGIITTVAGNGFRGFSGDGGPATAASLDGAVHVAVGADGSLYIADFNNSRIRRVAPDGIITTVAGNGNWGFSGDGGPATAASLSYPFGVAVDADGSLYIADSNNYRIRRVGLTTGISFSVPSSDGTELYQFDLNVRHKLTRNALTGGTLYEFGYDSEGRLVSVTDGSGNRTSIERNGAGEPTAIVGPYGQRTELTLDDNGYLASISNPAGETYRMEYTEDGLLTRFEDPRGNSSSMSYYSDGRLYVDANAAGGSQRLTREILVDTFGTQVTVTTAEGVSTSYRVEDLPIGDQRRSIIQPDGGRTISVTATDGKTSTQAPDGTTATVTRGPDPRFGMSAPLISQTVTTPGGRSVTTATTRTANLTEPTDLLSLVTLTDQFTLNGRTSTSVYDAATRTTTRTSAAGRITSTGIDLLGRPILTRTDGLEPVTYAYDSRGRLEALTQSAGSDARSVAFAYDADGYLASITDALGRSAGFEYDLAGRVTAQTFPDGREVLFDYDLKGNLTGLTPPGRPEHSFSYTPMDLTAEYIPPDVGAGSNSTSYSYNRDKQLTRVLRPDGEAVDLAYDVAGRLAGLSVPEGDFSYAYHATSGNLSRITAPDGGTLEFGYDGALLTGATWAGEIAGSVGFAYDNDFRLSSISVDGANPVAYSYDPDSLLTRAGSLNLTRDLRNGLLTGSTLGAVTDDWDYNGFGEPASYSVSQSGSPLIAIAYTRDPLGRITVKSETIGGVTTLHAYDYDLAGRLIEVRSNGVVQTSWGYDDNGNRTHVNGAEVAHYDDQDRLLDYAGTSYAYTANGELETRTQGASVTHYDYDVLGNLRQVTLPNGSVIDYLTDGRNRRIGKQVNGTPVQGFLYQDQLKPVAELDGAGNLVSRFVYATRVNVPDYMIKGGTNYRIITDHLGSPRLVANATTGAVVQRMDYDAWGNVLLDTNPGFQPFGFAGGLYDRDTGLVRFGARDYDAGVGRWLAKDPIGIARSDFNLFSYSRNDPIDHTDRTGLLDSSWDVIPSNGTVVGFNAGSDLVGDLSLGLWDWWSEAVEGYLDDVAYMQKRFDPVADICIWDPNSSDWKDKIWRDRERFKYNARLLSLYKLGQLAQDIAGAIVGGPPNAPNSESMARLIESQARRP